MHMCLAPWRIPTRMALPGFVMLRGSRFIVKLNLNNAYLLFNVSQRRDMGQYASIGAVCRCAGIAGNYPFGSAWVFEA